MSRQRTPPDQVQSTANSAAAEAHTARKHQLRHRSPRGQRGRPRVGLVGASSSSSAPPATSQDAAGGTGTTTTQTGSTRHRQRDKALATTRQQQWLLQMWSNYRKQVTIAAAILVLVLIISAIRIAFHTADYSAAAVYPPTRPNRAVSSRKPSPVTLNSAPSIAKSPKSESSSAAAAVVVKEEEEEENEKVLHEALDSAVRHALEDAWQLPPHAPASAHQAGEADSDRRHEDDGGGAADQEQQPAPQRSLAELYADLEELGISAHELNEVLDEAMRSTGDR